MFARHLFAIFLLITFHPAFLVCAQNIQVTQPSGGQQMNPGDSIEVGWNVKDSSGGGLTKIYLENPTTGFSRQISGLDFTLLNVGVGSHTWTWNSDKAIPTNDGYQIRVASPSEYSSSPQFVFGARAVAPTTPTSASSPSPSVQPTNRMSNVRSTSSASSASSASSSRLPSSTLSSNFPTTLTSSQINPTGTIPTIQISTNTTGNSTATSTAASSPGDLSAFGKIGIVIGGILGLVILATGSMTVASRIRRSRRKDDDSDGIPLADTNSTAKDPQVISSTPKFETVPIYQPPNPKIPPAYRPNFPNFSQPSMAPGMPGNGGQPMRPPPRPLMRPPMPMNGQYPPVQYPPGQYPPGQYPPGQYPGQNGFR